MSSREPVQDDRSERERLPRCPGYRLLDVEGDTPSRRTFVFDDAARADVQAYFRDEPVGGRSFASSLKMLKSAVHAGR